MKAASVKAATAAKAVTAVKAVGATTLTADPRRRVVADDGDDKESAIGISDPITAARTKGMWGGALTRVEIKGMLGAFARGPEDAVVDADASDADASDGDDAKSVTSVASDVKSVKSDVKSAKPAGPPPTHVEYVIKPIKDRHTPAVVKAFDELMVNASDQCAGQRKKKAAERVTRIDIAYDGKTFSVENDGPGIPNTLHKEASEMTIRREGVTLMPAPRYTPEVAFSIPLAGSNLTKAASNVKGGTNGLGAKIACVHATVIVIDNVDMSGIHYRQEFHDRLRRVGPAVITNLKATAAAAKIPAKDRAPHLRVVMAPAYRDLNYPVGANGLPHPDLVAQLDAWIRLRACQIAAYVNNPLVLKLTKCQPVRVTYNGKLLTTNSAESLARLHCTQFGPANAAIIFPLAVKATPAAKPAAAKAAPAAAAPLVIGKGAPAKRPATASAKPAAAKKPEDDSDSNPAATCELFAQHPWDVAIIVVPTGAKNARAVGNMLIVNGANSNTGQHNTYLRKLISDEVLVRYAAATKTRGKKATKTTKDGEAKTMGVADTMANVRIVMCGGLPFADWSAQHKGELQVPMSILRFYQMPAAPLKKVAGLICDRMLVAVKGKTKSGGPIDKYIKARKSGRGAESRFTALIAPEGDSALAMLRAGLSQNKAAKRPAGAAANYVVPNFDYCGTITLGGVIMNTSKEAKEIETADGEAVVVRSQKLQEQPKIKGIVNAWGLDYDCSYATAAERAKLNYRCFIICVDRDADGVGKIMSLVLTFFFTFFPNLIKHGCVGFFLTPLIRMYPKRGATAVAPVKVRAVAPVKVPAALAKNEAKKAAVKAAPLEFMYEEEQTAYVAAHPDWEAKFKKPIWIKGLAGHEDHEVKSMFQPAKFNQSLYFFTLDDMAAQYFKIYFGGGPDGPARRKQELRIPVAHMTPAAAAEMHRTRTMSCTAHLQIDTKTFKLEAIGRQIPHAFDGKLPTSRMIIDGFLDIFGSANKPMKLYQAGGRVAAERAYHHGDASLNATALREGQKYFNARQYPLLQGLGQWGGRHLGGKDAGSARYISVRLSPLARPMFPAEDRWSLPFTDKDGAKAEPDFTVPPVPLAILESGGSRPSEGWMHLSYGRDYEAAMYVVDLLLDGDAELTAAAEAIAAAAAASSAAGAPLKLPKNMAALEAKYPLPVSCRGFKGSVRDYKGAPHSFGDYVFDAKTETITITELPIGVATGGDAKVCPGYLCALVKPPAKRANSKNPDIAAGVNPRAALIESINDYSAAGGVEIEIKLKKGAADLISKNYGSASPPVDPFEDFLLLRHSLKSNLNYVGAAGTVLEFGSSYLAVLLYWFPARRDLYRRRIERLRVIEALRIAEETEILRYAGMYEELSVNKLDNEAADNLLSANEFPRLDSKLLHAPDFTPPEALEALVLGTTVPNHVSYEYIYALTVRHLTAASIAKRTAALAARKATLAALNKVLAEKPFPGVSIWRAEIAEIKRIVDLGVATDWNFGAKVAGAKKGTAVAAEESDDD